jgi:hypothetical protein
MIWSHGRRLRQFVRFLNEFRVRKGHRRSQTKGPASCGASSIRENKRASITRSKAKWRRYGGKPQAAVATLQLKIESASPATPRKCGARTRSGKPCRSPATKKRDAAVCTLAQAVAAAQLANGMGSTFTASGRRPRLRRAEIQCFAENAARWANVIRQFSVAVATSREGHRSPKSDRVTLRGDGAGDGYRLSKSNCATSARSRRSGEGCASPGWLDRAMRC